MVNHTKMEKNVAMLITFSVLIVLSSAADYCHIKSCKKPHTVCIFSKPGPSARCTGHQGSGLSSDEKRRIVDLHNMLRQKVASGQESRGSPGRQPRAKYMPNLEWDDEIAFVAQRWADQCTWGHDGCRNVDRFTVGQNIAYMGTTANVNSIRVESMVQMWYDEVKDFSKYQVSRFTKKGARGQMIGHYTQLVWAKSTKIGCGATKYKEGFFNKFYIVCNYGPAGNYLGQPVYEIA